MGLLLVRVTANLMIREIGSKDGLVESISFSVTYISKALKNIIIKLLLSEAVQKDLEGNACMPVESLGVCGGTRDVIY